MLTDPPIDFNKRPNKETIDDGRILNQKQRRHRLDQAQPLNQKDTLLLAPGLDNTRIVIQTSKRRFNHQIRLT